MERRITWAPVYRVFHPKIRRLRLTDQFDQYGRFRFERLRYLQRKGLHNVKSMPTSKNDGPYDVVGFCGDGATL